MPFTVAEFFDTFRRYNEAVWPLPWLLPLVAAAGALVALRGGARAGRLVSALLAALWLWMGLVYHLGFFRAINPAAVGFAALFVAQAALLAWHGVARGRLAFHARRDVAGAIGAALLLYALIGYPALGAALGHRWPATPTFGLPCPTTIYTLGLLAWSRPPRVLLAVPLLWAAIGGVGAVLLGVPEDYGLPVAALLCVVARWTRRGARTAHGGASRPAIA